MAIAQHSTVRDIRLVLDKFTGAPRGFAFVHFHSVADATRVLHALQVSCPATAAAIAAATVTILYVTNELTSISY